MVTDDADIYHYKLKKLRKVNSAFFCVTDTDRLTTSSTVISVVRKNCVGTI